MGLKHLRVESIHPQLVQLSEGQGEETDNKDRAQQGFGSFVVARESQAEEAAR